MLKRLSITFLLPILLSGQMSPAISDRAAARFLEQASWGTTPASIADVQQSGFAGWLTAQFALNTSDLPDQPILQADGKPNNNLGPVDAAFFVNTVTGQDQLRQRVAFALSEIWVVAGTTIPQAYGYPPYWRVLRDNAFLTYRDIMKAVTLNPMMGRYLNMANNVKANPAKGTAANENYARELMQLFSIGLNQLNPDGSPVVDANGNPVPTYTQAIVTQTAKALTGWTYPAAPGATSKAGNPVYYIGQMVPVEAYHDTSSKEIIGGTTIPAGQSGERDLESVLDTLMAQPTMAPFISKQLIQHLVTSNPSPAYIARVSAAFDDNGSGIKGDMKAVLTAILTDPEARAGDDPGAAPVANFGHLREPALWLSGVLRGLNAAVPAMNTVYGASSAMGQPLFYEESVFSYFSPNNSIGQNLLGPEFQIYTTQTAANRVNYVYGLTYGGVLGGAKADLSSFTQYGANYGALLDQIDYVFMHRGMSVLLRQEALNAAAAATKAHAAAAALYTVLASGEYSVIH